MGRTPSVRAARQGRRRAHRVRRDMNLGHADGCMYSAMIGLSEGYFGAFVLAVGLSEAASGLVNPIPQFIAAVTLLLTHRIVARVGSIKRWVVFLVTLQALAFLPLAVLGFTQTASLLVIYTCVTVYWLGSLGGGAAWNAWAAAIYPRPIRPAYFAIRTRLSQLFLLAGIVAGGVALNAAEKGGRWELLTFAALFGLAGTARLISAALLTGHSDPEPIPPGFRDVGFREFARSMQRERGGRLLAAMLAMQATTMVGLPFLTPYLLEQVDLSYAEFMLLIGAPVLTKAVALPTIGRLVKRWGARRLLRLGAAGIVPVPALWILHDQLWWLLACQVLAGAAWAMYELSSFLLIFDTLARHQRIGFLTRFNVANTLAIATGSTIGAAWLNTFNADTPAYRTLFLLCAGASALALPILFRVERTRPSSLPLARIRVDPHPTQADAPLITDEQSDQARRP